MPEEFDQDQIPSESQTPINAIFVSKNTVKPKFIHDLNRNSPFKYPKKTNNRGTRRHRGTQYLTLDNFQFTDKFIKISEEQCDQLEFKIIVIAQNRVYGNWKNGKLHGICKIEYKTGEYFQGKYEYGVRVEGILRFKDGSQYQGKFSEENFHGPGIITDPNKRKISCYWNKGVPGKRGRIQYPSGDIYLGELNNLKKHGKGTIYFKNGDKFIGNFHEGQIEGQGQYYSGYQKIIGGIWKNGFLQLEPKMREILRETLDKHNVQFY